MGSRASLLLVLLLLVSAPLSVLAEGTKNSEGHPSQEGHDAPLTESERLDLAASHWNMMPHASMVPVELMPATGVLHLASGSFDPLLGGGPEVPAGYHRTNDAAHTGMVMVQLDAPDGTVLDRLVKDFDLTVLDVLHDEGWLVRLPAERPEVLDTLGEEEGVRWVGQHQPGWRVAPTLLTQPAATEALAIVPTPDLGVGGYAALATDIVRYGGLEASCDPWMCYATADPFSMAKVVNHLALDGRILWTEPTAQWRVHNALAWSIAGVQNVANNATFTLDGSGEMIAIADTGLDQNHPDLTGRVAATFTQFGLDPSPADSNSGHGTHIAISVLGNGSGDGDARGVAPAANLVMYALEHDPTGTFGRIGSIYDMLRDAEQMTARISVNAWGLNGNYGQYTADARSVDTFVHDSKDLTPVFSVGDRGTSGASQVSSPATGKNVLAIGASTTGASGTPAAGAVVNFSSLGPSLDGRIKPDLVAPGVGVCSGLAEEAQNPAGPSCLTGTHAGGNAYYMTLSGTSQATAIASGVAGLTREFIREQVGVSSPSSSLVKAAMINGARDLGTPDIPNAAEGWGEVDLERTVLPMDGTTALDTFMDDKKVLSPGFGLLYSFSLDPSHGLDITLAWTDEAGSAIAPQSEARLVNNLDLVLVGPDGTEWLGNDFSQGFTTTGGTADDVNNVERIRVAPGVLPSGAGDYILKVLHRGGTQQDFALVMSAVATPTPQPDLAVFDGSILSSSENPLKDDLISIRLAWVNQGTSTTPSFDIVLEDTTTQTVLATATRPALGPGMIDSFTIFHQFTTTGVHTLRLSVDTGGVVDEMNDATSGTDNNIWVEDIEVMALGVRVVVDNEDGSVPETSEQRASNAQMVLDVRNESGIDVPLSI
ncbi:MAG: S8 family serine peptidase, partial [Candidatus Poseidoniales archaeon]